MSRPSAAISGALGCLQTEARTTAIVSASSGVGLVVGCFTTQDVGEHARSRVRTAQFLDHRALREERTAEPSDLVLHRIQFTPRLSESLRQLPSVEAEREREPSEQHHETDHRVERTHVS